jgi:hypothetical protein
VSEQPRFITELFDRQPELQKPAGPVAAPGTADPYVSAAVDNELAALAAAPVGRRNHQLNVSAFALARYVHAGHLNRHPTWDSLYATARGIGLGDHETRATLASAFGAATPRQVPELEKAPDVTVVTPPADDLDEAKVRERFPRIDWHELWAQEDEEEWIVEPILPARRHVALFSAPKVGKSLLLLELAVAIANGEDVLGTTLDRPRRVLYVDFENDPRGDIRTRLVAMGRKPPELDNLVYLSYPPFLPLDGHEGSQELLAACAEYGVEVVVIDTVSRTVRGEENENDTWIRFYRHTGLALKKAEIACIRLDHTGKDPSKGMRGGSAKYGDLDAVWSMTAVSDTTFRLECTANRMPVTEKILVLRREQLPHLHHAVEGGGPLAVATARQQQLVAQLNEIYGDQTPPSLRDAYRKLKDRGHGARYDNVRDAISTRELTFNRLPYGEDE